MMRSPMTAGMDTVSAGSRPRIAVFDVGGVLIDWNPRHLYRKLFNKEAAMEDFLCRICTPRMEPRSRCRPAVRDRRRRVEPAASRPGTADRRLRSPVEEMVAGVHAGTVDMLRTLTAARIPLYALTDFSAEKFPLVRDRYDFFELFAGIVVSGEIGAVKPDAAIFRALVETYGLDAAECLFIEDSALNVAGAQDFGMAAVRYTSTDNLALRLAAHGLL